MSHGWRKFRSFAARHRRAGLITAGIIVIVWLAAGAVLVLLGRWASLDGARQLDQATSRRTFASLTEPDSLAAMEEASDDFARAEGLLTNPVVAPVRLLPVVGRQVRAGAELNRSGSDGATLAADTLRRVDRIADRPAPQGPARIRVVAELRSVLAEARDRLGSIPAGTDEEPLVASLADAQNRLTDARTDAMDGLQRADTLLRGMEDLLAGGRYVVFGANNAEMRAGSGMFLSASPLTVSDGRLQLGEVRPTRDLILADGVPVPPELARNYPWLDPGEDFRNLGLTPRFPVSAEIASRMWAQTSGGAPVDGVIALDVEALRELLGVVGPVTVDGVRYDRTTARDELLRRQYRRFAGRQDERTDELGTAARAVFERIEAGDWSIADMATALVDAAQGRHLLMWSANATQQRAWEAGGVSGSVAPDSLSVSVLNRGGNKLDSYLAVTADVEVSSDVRGSTVRANIRLANNAPADEATYIAGPNIEGLDAGEYAGIVTVNVPGGATAFTVTGGEYDTLVGTDGPTRVRGRYVRIGRGETVTIEVGFRMPVGERSLAIEPMARSAREVTWILEGERFPLDRRRTLTW